MDVDPKQFNSRQAYPWKPDQGDGTYCNPIICADYSDPDAIRDGSDFYMVASSFNCTPGLPILHSKDLVNWSLIGHAVKNLPGERFDRIQPGCGVWAPAIRKHAGLFWIFFPMVDEGIYVTTARHPAGGWSEPHCVIEGKGLIDPCPLWDDDGQAYLVHAYARSRSGIKHILRVRPMAADGSKLLGEGQIVYNDPENQPTLEGPKFLKKDGYCYILAPAGGVGTGWQLVLRSRNIYGPYEAKKVLEQGSTPVNGPHQGALIELESGQSWFIHFQECKPYGRLVHLQPVKWVEGWPLMGVDHDGNGVGEPVGRFAKPDVGRQWPVAIPQTSDEFDEEYLGLQWQWQANHKRQWQSMSARPGWLRLFSQPMGGDNLKDAANQLLQKFPARAFTAQTRLEFSPARETELAGLAVMGVEYGALAIRKRGGGMELGKLINGQFDVVTRLETNRLDLRASVADTGVCELSYRVGEGEYENAVRFQVKEGVWIGAKIGVFSVDTGGEHPGGGYTDFDYVRLGPPGDVGQ